jgi:hypothetical protein
VLKVLITLLRWPDIPYSDVNVTPGAPSAESFHAVSWQLDCDDPPRRSTGNGAWPSD